MLAAIGFPITPACPEGNRDTGTVVLTQWFERARFEWHPDIPVGREVGPPSLTEANSMAVHAE